MPEAQQLIPVVSTHVQELALVDELSMNGSNGLPLRVEHVEDRLGPSEELSIAHFTFMNLCSIAMRPLHHMKLPAKLLISWLKRHLGLVSRWSIMSSSC